MPSLIDLQKQEQLIDGQLGTMLNLPEHLPDPENKKHLVELLEEVVDGLDELKTIGSEDMLVSESA